MNAVKQISTYIQKMPYDEPFTNNELLKFGSRANVDQILSRFVRAKVLTRVARGIFVKPKESSNGQTFPAPNKIVKAFSSVYGEIIMQHGAEAARQLELTTQVPTTPVFLTNGSTRHIKVGKTEITLKHVSNRKVANAGTIAGLVISALWYLGKNQVNKNTIEHIERKLTPQQFKLVEKNMSSMPIWMANAFYNYRKIEHVHA